jgi:hypothetical protein
MISRQVKLLVVSLDSVYGGKRSFGVRLAACGVQCGFGWRGKSRARDRAATSNYLIARRAFAAGNFLRSTGQNVEVDLDRAGSVGLSPPVCSTPCL